MKNAYTNPNLRNKSMFDVFSMDTQYLAGPSVSSGKGDEYPAVDHHPGGAIY